MRAAVLLSLALLAPLSRAQSVCDPRTFGARADGVTKDTAAVQHAIDVCAERPGGGMVRLAGGTFLVAPIVLRSNITLDVEPDAVLLASPDHRDYPRKEQFRAPGYQAFVSATDAQHIVITGGGVLDGNGKSWWDQARGTKDAGVLGSSNTRPRGLVLDHVQHVRIENVTVQNSAYWQIVPYYSKDVFIHNVRVFADPHSPNTDGIDPFSSTNVVIDNATIDVGDDNIAIKSGMVNSPGPDAPTSHVVIRNCHMLHGHGLSIGSELSGGANNIDIEHVRFQGTANGLRIKANRDRGGEIAKIVFRDVTMSGVAVPILVSAYYPKAFPEGTVVAAPVQRLTPHMHDILFDQIVATGSTDGGMIVGLPEAPVENIRLQHVQVKALRPMRVAYAKASFEDVRIALPQGGEGVQIAASAQVEEGKQEKP
ncbi:MAG: glycoside hydrolase family 28 protein [Acidobacteriaceae bacterium]|nr:glycoside hydrolase family 28 protein [Acidobacteriaceae bacterium]